jgi:hypothetical protein
MALGVSETVSERRYAARPNVALTTVNGHSLVDTEPSTLERPLRAEAQGRRPEEARRTAAPSR